MENSKKELEDVLKIIYDARPTSLLEMIQQNESVWNNIINHVDKDIDQCDKCFPKYKKG